MTDFGRLPPAQRRLLRFLFPDPRARAAHKNWVAMARPVLGTFRLDVARAGATAEVKPLVAELLRPSPEFKAMWLDDEVTASGETVKHIRHAVLGPLSIEYSAFAVEGRPDLTLVAYNLVTQRDAARIRAAVVRAATRAKANAK